MNNEKVVSIKAYQQKKNHNMLFLVIAAGAIAGIFAWNYFVINVARLDVQIPPSKNISFNQELPVAITTAQIANEFEKYDGKPILLYFYTTWCSICKENFANFNEIAREFQNTNLHIIALAIDRDINQQELMEELTAKGPLYFQPRFLAFKDGFKEFLQQKNIKYEGRIPFTALISADGKIIAKYSGAKRNNYLRNRIIGEI